MAILRERERERERGRERGRERDSCVFRDRETLENDHFRTRSGSVLKLQDALNRKNSHVLFSSLLPGRRQDVADGWGGGVGLTSGYVIGEGVCEGWVCGDGRRERV